MIIKHPHRPKTNKKLQESENDKDIEYPYQDREDAGDFENDQGTLSPRPPRMLAEDLIRGASEHGEGAARGMGRDGTRVTCLGL